MPERDSWHLMRRLRSLDAHGGNTRVRRTGIAAAAFALTSLIASGAAADIRIWEQNVGELWHHRYVELTGYLQPGFIVRANDDDSPVSDDHFWLQRARFGLRAKLHRWMTWRIELEAAPNPVLTDAYVEVPLHSAFGVRAGQFQLAFLRTFQIAEVNLAFIDRSIFTPQSPDRGFLRYLSPRDIGVMFLGRVGDTTEGATSPVLEYWAGMFLGRGANQIRNDDDAFLYSARLQLHALGVPDHPEAESDLARNEHPRVAVAAGGYTNCDDRAQWNRGWTADAELRYQGLFASAAFVWFRNGASSSVGDALGYGDFCTGVEGAPTHLATGASVQVQLVLPRPWFPLHEQSLEVLARFDFVDPNSPAVGFLGGDETSHGYIAPPNYRDSDNPPTRWRLSFGLNWFPTSTQTLRLALNYQLNRESEHVVEAGREIRAIDNDIFWLQLTAGL